MPKKTTSILNGLDYQHLQSWFLALELMQHPDNVHHICVEDDKAGSVDDVTVFPHTSDVELPSRFYQVKFHTSPDTVYSTEELCRCKTKTAKSLLQKFWNTWLLLRTKHQGKIELYLVSNTGWSNESEPIIDPDHETLRLDFISGTNPMYADLRKKWQDHIGASDESEFISFLQTLHFRLGRVSTELKERIAERMQNHGLKYSDTDLFTVIGIVKEWITGAVAEITLTTLDAKVSEHDLKLPPSEEPSLTIHMNTIKDQVFSVPPDYLLDWKDHFNDAGRQLKEPNNWNALLLPELKSMEKQVSRSASERLIRARGAARLSAWMAFGHTFRKVGPYVIEMDQYGQLWRTDARRNDDFSMSIVSEGGTTEGENAAKNGSAVAVGISLTHDIANDVREFTNAHEDIGGLLLLAPKTGIAQKCIRNAGDLVAMAEDVKSSLVAFVKKRKAKRLYIFYCGPMSGACFLGHHLNAVCSEIQIMEDQQPGYAPSFLLA
jgi:hypothetical protein